MRVHSTLLTYGLHEIRRPKLWTGLMLAPQAIPTSIDRRLSAVLMRTRPPDIQKDLVSTDAHMTATHSERSCGPLSVCRRSYRCRLILPALSHTVLVSAGSRSRGTKKRLKSFPSPSVRL